MTTTSDRPDVAALAQEVEPDEVGLDGERLRRLDYEFLREGPETAAAVALRFTLSVPGVDTVIVGTARPGRIGENAGPVAAGPLHDRDYEAIRARWRAVADDSWVGQV